MTGNEIHSEVGAPGAPEGAAGSLYVDIPFRLYGTLKSGRSFNLVGPVTLRRVNEVPGSTAEQREWHLARSGLKPRPRRILRGASSFDTMTHEGDRR